MESLKRGVEIHYLPPGERDPEVAKLSEPWIGDEGPLTAELRRGGLPRHPRGVAFDDTTTVMWDEAGVQVLRAVSGDTADEDVVVLQSPVIPHHRFAEKRPQSLIRIDYLRRGALLGSRFTTAGGDNA
jgi:hypothetical protein